MCNFEMDTDYSPGFFPSLTWTTRSLDEEEKMIMAAAANDEVQKL